MSDISQRFTHQVRNRVAELYGEPLPKDVHDRIAEELEFIADSKVYEMMLITADVFKGIGLVTEDIPVIGYCEGFYVAYLLGLNGGINPLPPHYRCTHCKHSEFEHRNSRVGMELPEKYCPVCGNLMMGEGFNILPQWGCLYKQYYSLCYLLNPDTFSAAIEAFRKAGFTWNIREEANAVIYFSDRAELRLLSTQIAQQSAARSEWRIASQLLRLSDLTGVRLGQIPFNNSTDTLLVRNALCQGNAFIGIQSLMDKFTEKVLMHFRLNGLYDLVRLFGICHHGIGVWFGNEELLLKNGTIAQDELPVCLEDIFEYLQKAGFDKTTAIALTEQRKRTGERFSAEQENTLRSHGVPRWFISTYNKAFEMGARLRAVSDAIMAWRLLYYKLCVNLGAFYQAYLDTADISLEYCWQICDGEKDLALDLEGIYRDRNGCCLKDEYTLLMAKEIMEQGFALRGLVRRAIDFRQIDPRKEWTQNRERRA